MSLIHSIQSFLPLPLPENRSRSEIERDLEDEFAFHLEMKTRTIQSEEGIEREAARGLARAQFGDVERIKRECQRIALKERIMLQRVNFALMLVVLAMLAVVGVQVMRTQTKTTQALEGIMSDLSRMKFEDGVQATSAGAGQVGGLVYIDGDVERKGPYQLPLSGQLTVRRAITAAGGGKSDIIGVVVRATDSKGNSIVRFRADRLDLRDKSAADYTLAPDDHIIVTAVDAVGDKGAAASDGARVLVEGDVPGAGWHVIDMDRGTPINALLDKIGARDDQWVVYRQSGSDRSQPVWRMPVAAFKQSREQTLLRPGDEIRLTNDESLPVRNKQDYYLNTWRSAGLGEWQEVDASDRPVVDGWTIRPADSTARRRMGSQVLGALMRPRVAPLTLDLTLDHTFAWIGSQEPYSGACALEWTVEKGRLVLDMTTLNCSTDPAAAPPEIDLAKDASLKRKIVFAASDAPAGPTAAADTRAQAVGDFVVRLFALADPNDPNLDQTVRDFLDSEEKAIDEKYADDPATAGMIRELIAARRKIFEADAAIQNAATAEQRTQAVTAFLENVLTSTDPQPQGVTVTQMIDQASQRLEAMAHENPELAATMRERLNAVRKSVEGDAAAPAADKAEPKAVSRIDDDEFPTLSPFREVRWKDYTPFVDINGTWGELVSIDGVSAADIIAFCRQRYGANDRQRFTGDLVLVMTDMGKRPGVTVKVQIKEFKTGTVMAIERAQMTEDNWRMLGEANKAATDVEPGYPVWSGEPPDSMQ